MELDTRNISLERTAVLDSLAVVARRSVTARRVALTHLDIVSFRKATKNEEIILFKSLENQLDPGKGNEG